MSHLLAISIGPVQDFIKAARKARDLWYGSSLLEEVSRAAAESLRHEGAHLIFPASLTLDNGGSVANKLLAILPDGLDPGDLAARARAAAQQKLLNQRDAVASKPASALDGWGHVDVALLQQHVESFVEFYAAWVPYQGDDFYAANRDDVEHLLSGRKALRDFTQTDELVRSPERAGRQKSSLDPSRESVLKDGFFPDRDSVSPASTRARARLVAWRVKQGERLDGISLVKRLASDEHFPSVARVAVDPFLRCVVNQGERRPEVKELLAELNKLASKLANTDAFEKFQTGEHTGYEHYHDFPYDTELFYNDGADNPGWDEHTKQGVKPFVDTVRTLTKTVGMEPSPYFALLAADGDQMGKAIGKMKTSAHHEQLSVALGRFAGVALAIVRSFNGAPIYSGGDDVLAFLPVDKALDCADALRRTFVESVQPAVDAGQQGETISDKKISVSLSVGLVIGHYREPLDNLLDWARAAEQRAKKGLRDGRAVNKGRNALVVSLHTASGGATAIEAFHRWDEGGNDGPVAAYWNLWRQLYTDDLLPDGAVYDLRRLARELRALAREQGKLAKEHDNLSQDQRPLFHTDVEALARDEARRILSRKRGQRGTRQLSEQEVMDMLRRMEPSPGAAPFSVLDALDALINELLIARRLAALPPTSHQPGAAPAEGVSAS